MRKIVATAALTIGAMAITGGTSYAVPETNAQNVQAVSHLAGDQGGIHYDTVRSDADQTVTTTLSGGTFVATGAGIQVIDAVGVVTDTLPVAIGSGANLVALRSTITDGGTKLVSQPQLEPIWYDCSPSSPRSRSIGMGTGVGAMIGVIAAAIIGIAIGVATMGVGIIALPFIALGGALIGMAIGGAAGASIPNSDQQDAWECRGP